MNARIQMPYKVICYWYWTVNAVWCSVMSCHVANRGTMEEKIWFIPTAFRQHENLHAQHFLCHNNSVKNIPQLPEHLGTMMCEGKINSAMKSSGSGTFTATSLIMHLHIYNLDSFWDELVMMCSRQTCWGLWSELKKS